MTDPVSLQGAPADGFVAASTEDELDALIAIGRRAAHVVMEVYRTAFDVEHKNPGDPVTEADREANRLICEALGSAFPGEPILAEETAPRPDSWATLLRSPRAFFVDPVDGTREFVERIEEFAVMIGVAEQGRAAMGVLVHPPSMTVYAGRVGIGATVARGEAAPVTLRVPDPPPGPPTLVVSRSRRTKLADPVCEALGGAGVLPCGSVGIKVSRILDGAAHLYLHGAGATKPWDTCGPEAVLTAAGGRFTDLAGARYTYDGTPTTRGIVAGLPAIAEQALAVPAVAEAAGAQGGG